MKELKFKTLMHRGEFVSIVNFGIGHKSDPEIAYRTTPQALPDTTTMDGLKRFCGKTKEEAPDFYEHLEKCELVDIAVIVHEKSDGE